MIRTKATTEQIKSIDAMRVRGIKYKDIAKAVGLGCGTVYRAHKRADGYTVGARKMYDFGANRKHRTSIPFEVVPKIDELIANGHKYKDISAAMSCGWQVIRDVHRRLDAYKTAPAKLIYTTDRRVELEDFE